jgi:hypothetical protein
MRQLLRLLFLAAFLLGLPLLGLWVAGRPIAPYLEVPPRTEFVEHPGFSWPVFVVAAGLYVAVGLPFVLRLCRWRRQRRAAAGEAEAATVAAEAAGGEGLRHAGERHRFPWWGWAGLALLAAAWGLAWTRLAWFRPWQEHTFTPLWVGYILVVNALCVRRGGASPLTARPGRFLLLVPASAAFWWFFEYLNRFVQNWHYRGGGEALGPWAYAVAATLPFATVLPAVLSTRALLATFPGLVRPFRAWRTVAPAPRTTRRLAAAALLLTAAGLAGIGLWPHLLFGLLWVSPLAILVSLQALGGRRTLLHPLRRGDWRPVVTAALAALVCGFFWELWNAGSLAHWRYAVPYVDRFHLFRMPLLGYGGYLTFGLECALIGDPILHDEASL